MAFSILSMIKTLTKFHLEGLIQARGPSRVNIMKEICCRFVLNANFNEKRIVPLYFRFKIKKYFFYPGKNRQIGLKYFKLLQRILNISKYLEHFLVEISSIILRKYFIESCFRSDIVDCELFSSPGSNPTRSFMKRCDSGTL